MQHFRKWLAVVVVILAAAGIWRWAGHEDGDANQDQHAISSAKQSFVGSWFGSDDASRAAGSTENAAHSAEAQANELPNLNTDAGELSTTLEVVVRDKSDKRVPGADVSVYYLGTRDTLTHQRQFKLAGKSVTDSNGVIELKVPSGTFSVAAKAGGPSALKQVSIAVGTMRTRVDLQLEAGHLVNLLCVEAASAKPVPLCQVTLKPRSVETPSLEHHKGEADASARLQLGPLSPGHYQAEVSAHGFAKLHTMLAVPVNADPVLLRLKAAATLAGKVLDQSGKEVAGATVQLTGAYSPQTTTTGSAGGFTFDVSEAEYSLSARKDGAAGALPKNVFATAGETKSDLVITLGTAASLSGKVVDKKTQQVIEGAEVAASPFGEDGDSGRTYSKADGTFELTGLAAGSYDLEVRKDNYARAAKTGITVEPAQNFPLVFELEETGKVTGVVTDDNGTPLVGVTVAIKWQTGGATLTGPDGRYTLGGLENFFGTMVEVHRDGDDSVLSKRVKAKPGETAVVDFVLPGVGYVSGTVTTPEGAPANNVMVMAFVPGVGFRGASDYQVNVDSAGAYELRLTKGDYAMVVVEPAAKSLPKIQERFSLAAGERKQVNLKTAKPEENDLEGEVREADGRPAGNTPLTIEGVDTPIKLTTFTDDAGHFEQAIPRDAGHFKVTANRRGRQATLTFDLAQKALGVVLTLPPPTSVRGEVRRADGKPVSGFSISLVSSLSSFGEPEERQFAGHTFHLNDVPVGKLELIAMSEGLMGTSSVTTRAEDDTQVTITLQPACSVRGKVVGVDPAALEQTYVYLDPGEHIEMERNASGQLTGAFFVEQTRCGPRTLAVSIPKQQRKHPFTLEPGKPLDLGEVK